MNFFDMCAMQGMANHNQGDGAMFAHEQPEMRIRHLWEWFEEDSSGNRMLPAQGLAPLQMKCPSRGWEDGWQMALTGFDMEIMSAQMSLAALASKHGKLICTCFLEKMTGCRTMYMDNLLSFIVRPPCLSNDSEVYEQHKQWRYYTDKEAEPLNPLRDPVYFHFLLLGPLPLLKLLLQKGGIEVRSKLEVAALWQHVIPQLELVSSYQECLPKLRGLIGKCVELINSEPQACCSSCGASEGKLLRCAGCPPCSESAAMYCGAQCQKAHWKAHKKVCERRKQSKNREASLQTGEGRKQLQRAINEDDVDAVRALLTKGVHPDTPVDEFGSGLHISSLQNRLEVVRVFVEHGANLNLKSSMGETPLMLAVMYGHAELVRFYIEHGAQTDILDLYGKTLQQKMETSHGRGEDLETIRELISCVA